MAGEDAAAVYLQKAGYRIIERNFRCRFGEIDAVALLDEMLVFVEVRYRRKGGLVTGEESVSREKVRRLRLAIRRYLAERAVPEANTPIRVDLCVVPDAGDAGEGGANSVFRIIPGIIEFS